MKIILASRGMGKTTQAISESAAMRFYIVCRNRETAHRIVEMAEGMEKSIPFPITFDEFLTGEYFGKSITGFIIDDADALIQYISKVPVKTITLSPD